MDDNFFSYTYSASRQNELDEIRRKYVPHDEDKMDRLRRLDRRTETKAAIIYVIIGLFLGIVGFIGMAAATPLYRLTVKKEREKIAPEILKLIDEISGVG